VSGDGAKEDEVFPKLEPWSQREHEGKEMGAKEDEAFPKLELWSRKEREGKEMGAKEDEVFPKPLGNWRRSNGGGIP